MNVLSVIIVGWKFRRWIQESWKLIALHLLYYGFVIFYCTIGTIIFIHIERPSPAVQQSLKANTAVTTPVTDSTSLGANGTVTVAQKQCGTNLTAGSNSTPNESKWSFASTSLLTFQLVTTIGYGHISPTTVEGRVFCIFFSLIGIPLWLLLVTDISKYLSYIILKTYNVLDQAFCRCFGFQHVRADCVPGWLITCILILYASVSCMFSLAGHIYDPFQLLYMTFVTITTIGFGDEYPKPTEPILMYCLLVYFTFGLVIAALFIDRFSEILRQFHNFGIVLRNSPLITIWIGRNKTTVGMLAENTLKSACVPTSHINQVLDNLDGMIESGEPAHLELHLGVDVATQTPAEPVPQKVVIKEVYRPRPPSSESGSMTTRSVSNAVVSAIVVMTTSSSQDETDLSDTEIQCDMRPLLESAECQIAVVMTNNCSQTDEPPPKAFSRKKAAARVIAHKMKAENV